MTSGWTRRDAIYGATLAGGASLIATAGARAAWRQGSPFSLGIASGEPAPGRHGSFPRREHLATIPLPTRGRAFAWDRSRGRTVRGVDRKTKQVIESSVPAYNGTR